ncbi:MAG: hypothetical protein AMXMBFR53_20630 [Gemmatimonadota bacterium]
MDTRMAYCATCDRPVRVVLKEEAANRPGGEVTPDDVVCLEHGETCGAGTVCPIFDVPSEDMKARLDAHRRGR